METQTSPSSAALAGTADAQHIAELTGMTRDAARTFLEFHSGMRWLRRDDD